MQAHTTLDRLSEGPIHLHRHCSAYATIVRSGEYVEAAIDGQVRITPATLVVHPVYHLHSDHVFEAGEVWNVELADLEPKTWRVLKGAGVERLAHAERKPHTEEVLSLLEEAEPIEAEPLPAWLSDFAALSVTAFSDAQDEVSREHAHRTFKRHFGMSPGRYRRERHLQAALGMIRAGASLAETAVAAGFSDQSHMTRVMKRELALTPGEMQRQITPVQ